MNIDNQQKSKRISPHAIELVQQLEDHVSFDSYSRGARFVISANSDEKIYIIKSGTFAIARLPDDFLYWIFEGPTVRGIRPDGSDDFAYVLKVLEFAEIAVIPYKAFSAMLTKLNLWDLYVKHMHSIINTAARALHNLNHATSYKMIRAQLYELIAEPESVRKSISVERYIRDRTPLSRSLVMSVLSKLREGKFIKINRGVLIEIFSLPDDF